MKEKFIGVIIEESLKDKSVLNKIRISSTRIEKVSERHKTPWLSQWTLHTVEIPEDKAKEIAKEISKTIDTEHGHWYADFKNDTTHFIIFRDKIFKIDRTDAKQYKEAEKYGIDLGIPEYQVDFSPFVQKWKR